MERLSRQDLAICIQVLEAQATYAFQGTPGRFEVILKTLQKLRRIREERYKGELGYGMDNRAGRTD